ncbi:DUF4386 domain-containing protein [Mangrovibacterium sp.]|uniref:DUF4386 domain-containing protein n=1 Tax=Mangrovibacterium sp. TaxID=1961364 RepID=UPI00356A89EB
MNFRAKKYGIVAGISLVLMAIVAGFTFGYAHRKLGANSPEGILNNLIANTSLFYTELAGWSIIFIFDLIVAFALYGFFRNASKQLSAITAFIRVFYTLLLGIAILQLFKIVPAIAIDNPIHDHLTAVETAAHFQLFERLWSIGLIIFGLHLIGLGALSLKSQTVPKPIGYLLFFGGLGYTFLHGARQLSFFDPNQLQSVETFLAFPMALAEILLAFWLLYSGLRKPHLELKN